MRPIQLIGSIVLLSALCIVIGCSTRPFTEDQWPEEELWLGPPTISEERKQEIQASKEAIRPVIEANSVVESIYNLYIPDGTYEALGTTTGVTLQLNVHLTNALDENVAIAQSLQANGLRVLNDDVFDLPGSGYSASFTAQSVQGVWNHYTVWLCLDELTTLAETHSSEGFGTTATDDQSASISYDDTRKTGNEMLAILQSEIEKGDYPCLSQQEWSIGETEPEAAKLNPGYLPSYAGQITHQLPLNIVSAPQENRSTINQVFTRLEQDKRFTHCQNNYNVSGEGDVEYDLPLFSCELAQSLTETEINAILDTYGFGQTNITLDPPEPIILELPGCGPDEWEQVFERFEQVESIDFEESRCYTGSNLAPTPEKYF